MKTIGIIVQPLVLERYTGTERYLFELLREMKEMPLAEGERIILYSSREIEALNPLPAGWEWKILSWRWYGWTHIRMSAHLLWQSVRRLFGLGRPDILFVPVHEIPRFAGTTKVVTTVHDIAFDMVPEVYSRKEIRRQHWSLRRSLRRAAHVLTVSESTKRDVMRLYGASADKITATPLAAASTLPAPSEEHIERTLTAMRLPRRQFLLYVGRLELKKGIPELLAVFDAYKQARGIGNPLQLVLVGKFGHGEAQIKAQLRQLGPDDIHLMGFVPDEDLAVLFATARAFVFPTRYEGFGIPVLEAMEKGVPVVCTDLPVLREVAGGAAVFAERGDMSGWVKALRQVLENDVVERDLRRKGLERAAQFSWKKTADTTMDVLRRV